MKMTHTWFTSGTYAHTKRAIRFGFSSVSLSVVVGASQSETTRAHVCEQFSLVFRIHVYSEVILEDMSYSEHFAKFKNAWCHFDVVNTDILLLV